LITHPDLALSGMSLEDQQALAADGAILEKDIITMMPAWQSLSLQQMVASIRAIGPAHCALATDFGQLHHPVPPEGMRMFVQLLLEQGITPEDIRTMVAEIQRGSWESTRGFEEVTRRRTPHRWQGRIA